MTVSYILSYPYPFFSFIFWFFSKHIMYFSYKLLCTLFTISEKYILPFFATFFNLMMITMYTDDDPFIMPTVTTRRERTKNCIVFYNRLTVVPPFTPLHYHSYSYYSTAEARNYNKRTSLVGWTSLPNLLTPLACCCSCNVICYSLQYCWEII